MNNITSNIAIINDDGCEQVRVSLTDGPRRYDAYMARHDDGFKVSFTTPLRPHVVRTADHQTKGWPGNTLEGAATALSLALEDRIHMAVAGSEKAAWSDELEAAFGRSKEVFGELMEPATPTLDKSDVGTWAELEREFPMPDPTVPAASDWAALDTPRPGAIYGAASQTYLAGLQKAKATLNVLGLRLAAMLDEAWCERVTHHVGVPDDNGFIHMTVSFRRPKAFWRTKWVFWNTVKCPDGAWDSLGTEQADLADILINYAGKIAVMSRGARKGFA